MAFGDHVRVRRINGLYYHHGIDIGNGWYVHYSGELGQKEDASVRCDPHETFAQGGDIELIKYSRYIDPEEVVNRATSLIGEQDYNLFNNNCEHFAYWCKMSEHSSEQVKDAVAGSTGTVSTVAATAVGIGAVLLA